jgi:nucleoside-diphosphate-sugar epimerase
MRIFLTGATGFIGSAIVRELIGAGHQVLGLARTEEAGRALIAAGAQVHRGSLENQESLRSGAAMSDGVIHTAFIHDFSKYKENCEIDRLAIEALGDGLAGTGRPLVVTSGTAVARSSGLLTEDQQSASGSDKMPRLASEEAAAAVAARGVRVAVVRLPLSVHGEGDHGFVPVLIGLAREKGVAAYIGDGLNRWPAVHRLDAARAFRLVVENDAAAGNFHVVGEEGIAFKNITGIIGRRLNVPVANMTASAAAGYFGWFAHFAGIDNPTGSRHTRELLGWEPVQPGLLPDIDSAHYFNQ